MARRIRLPFRIPFFRIFYSTTYTTLYIIELIFLAASPTSLIYEAIIKGAIQYVLIIGAAYILVILVVIFIYTSRLYQNRTVLAALGKSHVPVESIPRRVGRLIEEQIERSAIVSLECRPRNLAESECDIFGNLQRDARGEVGRLVKVNPQHPPWAIIQHPGWSSPDPGETKVTPQVEFLQIINELPNLLEARVVSLGGPPHSAEHDTSHRAVTASPRAYLEQLLEDGIVDVPECAEDFLELYEMAKFSGRPFSEVDFITLTAVFSDLLAGLSANQDMVQPDAGPIDSNERLQLRLLEPIEDGASYPSASTRTGRVLSDADSIGSGRSATAEVIDDQAATRRPAQHERSVTVLHAHDATREDRRSQALGRKGSTSSLASAISMIHQARIARSRTENTEPSEQ